MKVARYRAYGGPEHIEFADAPDPVAAEGMLLVKTHASSVNPVDWKIAQGFFPFNIIRAPLPYVPGHDVSGVVERASASWRKNSLASSRPSTSRRSAA